MQSIAKFVASFRGTRSPSRIVRRFRFRSNVRPLWVTLVSVNQDALQLRRIRGFDQVVVEAYITKPQERHSTRGVVATTKVTLLPIGNDWSIRSLHPLRIAFLLLQFEQQTRCGCGSTYA